jgi:hypothetical protein
MSAYKRIQCSIVDKEALLAALKELGLTPAVYDSPQALRGFQGDSRSQTAEIIVDRQQLNKAFTGASNDLGFRFDEASGEFIMICSDYDQSCQIDQRVKQAYAKVVIEKALRSQGFKVKVTMPEETSLTSRKRTRVNIQGRKVV